MMGDHVIIQPDGEPNDPSLGSFWHGAAQRMHRNALGDADKLPLLHTPN